MSESIPDYLPPKQNRTHAIKVRVNSEELAVLHMHRKRTELARWMREVCLASGQGDMIDDMPPSVDPALLRQLAGIGNNINQIARALHKKDIAPTDRVQALASLVGIEADLSAIRKAHTQ
jgi:hypothetical protein